MYDQIREEIFLMFYASVAMLSLIACCYLLFRWYAVNVCKSTTFFEINGKNAPFFFHLFHLT